VICFLCFRCFIRWFRLSSMSQLKLLALIMGANICLVILRPIFANKALSTKPRVDTPQQNDVVERKNQHLLEVTHSLMLDTHVPKSYWGDALLITTYLINRMPSRLLDFKTPLEVMSPPLYSAKCVSSKVFSCVCFVHIHGPTKSKLDPRSLKCVFVGYSPTQKGYKCYHPPSRKYFVSMDVTFFEQQSYFSSTPSPLQWESQIEEDFLTPLSVPTPIPEPKQQ
jgi:hypothetical protein